LGGIQEYLPAVELRLVDQIVKWIANVFQDDDFVPALFTIPKYWGGTWAASDACIHLVFMIEP